jgi:putative phosphoribosyl transferase
MADAHIAERIGLCLRWFAVLRGRAFFRDREDAGRQLAEKLADLQSKDVLVLGIPCGGVPVAVQIADRLHAQLDLMVVRKLQIPWNPEAGFGALAPDGTLLLNPELTPHLNLSEAEVEEVESRTMNEIKRRIQRFRGTQAAPRQADRTVVLVDDGLASGYTMLVAAQSVRKARPRRLVVAVPVASAGAARLLKPACDSFVALHVSSALPFAVADFYEQWYDLTDEDVLCYLSAKPKRTT